MVTYKTKHKADINTNITQMFFIYLTEKLYFNNIMNIVLFTCLVSKYV